MRAISLALGLVPLAASPALAGNWLTFAGSPQRLGVATGETVLTPSSVAGGLKIHWKTSLGAATYTQPLYVQQLTIKGNTHNEVFATTIAGQVFALNATTGAIDWQVQLGTGTPSCSTRTIGIGGTPTIDAAKKRLYVVDGVGKLHALGLTTGKEVANYPIQVIDSANLAGGVANHSSPTQIGNTLYFTTSVFGPCEGSSTNFHGSVNKVTLLPKPKLANTFFPVGNNSGLNGGGLWGPGGASATPDDKTLLAATGNSLPQPQNQQMAESVLALNLDLSVAAAHQPALDPHGDYDFGSSPTPVDVSACPGLLVVMNKLGGFYLYNRSTIASGPVQVLDINQGGGSSTFIGMAAFDPAVSTVFVDNPVGSADGTYTHGIIAFKVTSACQLGIAWQTTFGTGSQNQSSHPTDPLVAGGVVYLPTWSGNSVLAFNETDGTLLWSSGTQMTAPTNTPVLVSNGQLFVQSGSNLYAWGL